MEEKLVSKKDLEQIGTLEHFGWVKVLDSNQNTKSKILLQRDQEMPYYNEIVKYEDAYQKLQVDLYPVYKLHMVLFVFLTLMLIVPGLVYKIVVNNHNARIEEHNNLIYEKMDEILEKASHYITK